MATEGFLLNLFVWFPTFLVPDQKQTLPSAASVPSSQGSELDLRSPTQKRASHSWDQPAPGYCAQQEDRASQDGLWGEMAFCPSTFYVPEALQTLVH